MCGKEQIVSAMAVVKPLIKEFGDKEIDVLAYEDRKKELIQSVFHSRNCKSCLKAVDCMISIQYRS